jgi:endonuclease/exonuclease/phosphatase (EEP) superfamily protein YafD
MRSGLLEWSVASALAGWAAARLAGADRLRPTESWVVPALSFTPQVTAGAWASALLLRRPGPAALAAAAGAVLTAAVGPRAVPQRQPSAAGPRLRILTANVLFGRVDAKAMVELAGRLRPDVLFMQELTDDAETRLERAGLRDLLPYRAAPPVRHRTRSSIFARYPLHAGPAATGGTAVRCTARLDLPTGPPVELACIHAAPPKPAWSAEAAARWRGHLAAVPAAGERLCILAGDFNATLDHTPFRQLLSRGYVDAASQAGNGLSFTWGPRPGRRPALLAIDHVLASPRCAVVTTSAHRLGGTDHSALYAELRLPAR